MSSQQDEREANFTSLCKELYPRLEVADSIFVEALRKHKDEGLAMEEVANWQPWESQATIPDPAPQPKPEDPLDSIERQKREYEKFEKANRDRLEREQREKEEQERAKREQEEAEKALAKLKEEEEARARSKREEEARARAKREKEAQERAKREQEARERAKREREAKERTKREQEAAERAKRDQEAKERAKRDQEAKERAKRDQEAKERAKRELEAKERAKRDQEAAERAKREQEAAEKVKRDQEEAEKALAKLKEEKEKLERVRREMEEEERAKAAEKAKEEKIKAEMREQLRRQIEEEERERIKQELKLEEERRLRAEMEAEAKVREAKGKEGEDGEEQNIGDIYEQLADLKDMNVDFVGANAPPRISIYVGKESDLPEADHSKIKDLFMQKGIKEEEIRILDVAADMEIQQFLKSSLKQDTLVFPIVCVDGQPIGSPSEVFKMDDKQIEKILASAPEDTLFHTDGEASSDVSLGALNQVLYAGEYLASGVGSLLMLPVTAITWPFRSAPVDYSAIKSEKDVEFDVIHTNWYWRSQWRVFRFTDEYVARVHPRHKDIRAAHKYDTVSEIQVTDSKNIVLHYCNNQSPDYLHAKEEHVKEMVKIIKSKNPNVVCTKPEEQ